MRSALLPLISLIACSAPSQPISGGRPAVANVMIVPSNISLQLGRTAQLSAIVLDSTGTTLSNRVARWSIEDAHIAAVSNSGLLTAAQLGATAVHVTIEGRSAVAPVAVSNIAVASVSVTLPARSLAIGQSMQAAAVTTDADGIALTGRIVSWTSSNTSAATISAAGLITAVGAGGTTIVATSEGILGTAALSVTAPPPAPVATVTVSLIPTTLIVGQTGQATASLKDASGNTLTGRTVTWTSSNTAVATMTSAGLVTAIAVGTAGISATSEGKTGLVNLTVAAGTSAPKIDTIYREGFESGTLSSWDDGVNPAKHQVLTSTTAAHEGSHYLQVTYPAGGDGGWLTHFFMPGYDSLYARFYVRFPATWTGGTKLLLLRGSRTDNEWSSFGVAGSCPTGTDFFATNVIADVGGDPGPVHFYSYYPAMAREPDGVTCWGQLRGTGTMYPDEATTMTRGNWHLVEFWVKLNKPGSADALQRMWVDGVLKGEWTGLSFRSSTILRINSVTLELSAYTTSTTRTLDVDDILVTTARPAVP